LQQLRSSLIQNRKFSLREESGYNLKSAIADFAAFILSFSKIFMQFLGINRKRLSNPMFKMSMNTIVGNMPISMETQLIPTAGNKLRGLKNWLDFRFYDFINFVEKRRCKLQQFTIKTRAMAYNQSALQPRKRLILR
jgi:hypothetical protein